VKLFVPGPTEVREDVLAEMARPMVSHRSAEMIELQKTIAKQAADILFTANPILLSTSSGTGLMEGGIRNGVERRVLSLVCGAFGERWHRIALDCGKDADKVEVAWGRAVGADLVERALSTGRYDALTVAHSETSTGVANPIAEIAAVVRRHPDVVF